MCWRHEARNGFSASGETDPRVLASSTELASSAATAPATAGSFRLPPFRTAVCSALPASQTWSESRAVSVERRPEAALASGPAVEPDGEFDMDIDELLSPDGVEPPLAVLLLVQPAASRAAAV